MLIYFLLLAYKRTHFISDYINFEQKYTMYVEECSEPLPSSDADAIKLKTGHSEFRKISPFVEISAGFWYRLIHPFQSHGEFNQINPHRK